MGWKEQVKGSRTPREQYGRNEFVQVMMEVPKCYIVHIMI